MKSESLKQSFIDTWNKGILGKITCLAAIALAVGIIWAVFSPGAKEEASQDSPANAPDQISRVSTPEETARELIQNYDEMKCSILTVMHRGSRVAPRQNVPYWIGNSPYLRFSGSGVLNLFGFDTDFSNNYYDICVVSSHPYVDGQAVRPGFYLYDGIFTYTTNGGSERSVHKFRELDSATASALGKLVDERKEAAEKQRLLEEQQREAERRQRVLDEKKRLAMRIEKFKSFIAEYTDERFWCKPTDNLDDEGVGSLKKKFRYCDKVYVKCNSDKVITSIIFCATFEKTYSYDVIVKECQKMLFDLDDLFGINLKGKGRVISETTRRKIGDSYEYSMYQSDIGPSNKPLPPARTIAEYNALKEKFKPHGVSNCNAVAVEFRCLGNPPVKHEELPPLEP